MNESPPDVKDIERKYCIVPFVDPLWHMLFKIQVNLDHL
jgi:hypothetical protein